MELNRKRTNRANDKAMALTQIEGMILGYILILSGALLQIGTLAIFVAVARLRTYHPPWQNSSWIKS